LFVEHRIISLEDVLEELLQEEIYDENDQMKKEGEKIALWVSEKWKRKQERDKGVGAPAKLSLSSIVSEAVDAKNKKNTSESTRLLQSNDQRCSKKDTGLLGSIFQSIGFK
tara:strand:- start:65 stop:397 length:333 start_codon:yes stop_codon:yes gene_type:complete